MQWVRVDADGTNPVNIGTDSGTYALVAADVGKKIKVEVSFQDDDGNDEEVTSEPYPSGTATVAAANNPATGAPAISGTARAGETLTAAKDTIADADGLPATFPDDYTLQWVRVDADGESNPVDIGTDSSTYALVAADVGKKIKVEVSFQDDDGNDEEVTSEPYPSGTATVAAANNPATGAPAISGTARAGETLTAAKDTIADTDGLPATFPDDYTLQWVRVDADGESNSVDIGTDSSTYMLVAADEGKKIKVRVSFQDNEGNDEALTGAAYPSGMETVAEACEVLWCATLTVGNLSTLYGYSDLPPVDIGSLSPDSFTRGTAVVGVPYVAYNSGTGGQLSLQIRRISGTTPADGLLGSEELALTLGSETFTFTAGLGSQLVFAFDAAGLSWNEGDRVKVSLAVAAANNPATGAPAISGTARAGETLTAAKDTIADADGLPATFPDDYTLQWVRVDADGTNPVNIGTDLYTYALVAADVGKKIKVEVSFQDDDGNDEEVTSEPYPSGTATVGAANNPATGAPAISGTARAGETLTAAKDTIADADGLPATFPDDYTLQWVRVDADGESNSVDIGTDSSTYALVAADVGKKIKVEVSFQDDDGNDEEVTSEPYPSGTATVGAANNPATGAPAISGTARAGETLTAAKDTIADADGLPATFPDDYTLQWVRVDADGESNPVNIGTDSGTYALVAADVGKKIKVEVSFQDDDGNDEEVTSEPYPSGTATVAAANNPATGAPAISGTARAGETLTAAKDTIADADGLPATFPDDYTLQWVRVDADGTNPVNIGTDSGTYALVAADVGKKIKVEVSFQDDDGNDEEVTSEPYPSGTATVAAANNPATGAPAISGTARAGETLTAAKDTIADADGLPDTFPDDYTLQWVRVDADGESNSVDIGTDSSTYMLVAADEGKKIKVRVSFQDDDGNDEEVTSEPYPSGTATVGVANNPATGAPAISGTARAGETLTAAKDNIADADGLPATFPDDYTLQWVRVDADGESNSVDIGTDSSTYMLVAADEGKKIKVRVSFQDNEGNDEALTGAAYPSGMETVAEACEVLWCATLTVGNLSTLYGYSDLPPVDIGSLSPDSFTRGTAVVGVPYVAYNSGTGGQLSLQIRRISGTTPADGLLGSEELALTLGSETFTFTAGLGSQLVFAFDAAGLSWNEGDRVKVSLAVAAANNPATGVPAISGTARVGETLTAARGSIEDTDGLPATFPDDYTLQWVRVDADGTNPVNIGTDLYTYALVAADVGKKIKVEVSFQDDDGNDEEVTSEPYPSGTATVGVANNPATGVPAISGTARVGETLTAAKDTIADADGLPATFPDDYTLQWVRVDADGTNPVNIGTDLYTYALVAADVGKKIKVEVSFQDDDGNDEEVTSEPYPSGTATVGVANNPATGVPAISGTARVGETLTAAKDTIADADGLPATFPDDYTLQWVRVDADGESNSVDIGTDSGTYALVAADVGKKIKVEVSFQDDDGNDEEVTSEPYPSGTATVAAANNPATGAPAISGTARAGETLTAAKDTIADADGLPATFPDDYTLQWVRVDADGTNPVNIGTDSGTYALVAADVGKKIKVEVSFQDDDGNDEEVTSEPYPSGTATVAAANNPATGAPAISGTARAGETLTAAKDTIADADGLPDTFPDDYTLQWVRVDADGESNSVDIGTDSSTYMLVAADEGKKIKVRVSFQDDDGNDEEVTSEPYPSGTATVGVANNPATGAPAISGTARAGETLTAAKDTIADADGLPATFPDDYTLQWVRVDADGTNPVNIGTDSGTYALVAADVGKKIKVEVSFQDDDGNDEEVTSEPYPSGTATVAAANNPATGAPAISGTARAGETLTAAKDTIADADGLPATFPDDYTLQWVRVDADGTNPVNIGTDSGTYALVAADVGKKIKVEVSFQDDDGNDEEVTSEPYPSGTATVAAANNPATGAPAISGTARAGETLTAAKDTIADADGLPATFPDDYTLQWVRVDADGTNPVNIGTDSGTYALVAADVGKKIKVEVSFQDDDGNDEEVTSEPYPSGTATVAAANNPATGAPAISGTARAGETLTAAIGNIADTDDAAGHLPGRLHLPVGPGECGRYEPGEHRDRLVHLRAGGGRRGQEDQGGGELPGQGRRRRGSDQCRLSRERDGWRGQQLRHRRAGHIRDGAGRRDADRGDRQHRRHRHAAGHLPGRLHLPVGPGECGRYEPGEHRDRLVHLRAGGGRRGQEDQGGGELPGQGWRRRGSDQRAIPVGHRNGWRGQQPRHRGAGDIRHGAGRGDADRGDRQHRRHRRAAGHLPGRLHLAVGPGECGRDEPGEHRDRLVHLRAGGGRRGQEDQGAGQLPG